MRNFVAGALLALPACHSATEVPPGPPFDPIDFFTGTTRSTAVLRQVGSGERKLTVAGVGTPKRDGDLILDQRISIAGRPSRTRRWVMRETAPGHYSGSLTDAVGPFEARQVGGAVRIRYTMPGGLDVEQYLVPIAGRNALDNRLTVRKWGVRLAFVRETIVKQP